MAIYRLILTLALPLMLLATLLGRWRGRLPKGALAERLGRGSAASGQTLWLHGASLGEVTSARWLVSRLLAETPGLRLLVTSNTATARAVVQGWGLPGVTAALAPLDTAATARAVLARWQPRALIVIENELWPTRLATLAAAGVPVLVIGARMSERSARRWRMAPGLIGGTLRRINWLSAQDAGSEARLLALGLPPDRLGPRMILKAMVAAAPEATDPNRARTLLAASTHPGEDAPILAAFGQARAQFDRLILAPRHPERGPAIAALIAAQGFPFTTQSKGEAPVLPVHLADTLGEMPRWYAMAGVTVIGGTFQDHGGHTPFEPAAQGSAILHGPFTANFTAPFAALATARGAVALPDARSLAEALRGLTPQRQAALAAAARDALQPAGDPEALMAAIRRLGRLTSGAA